MKKKTLSMVVILSVVALATSFGFAGGPAPEQGSAKSVKGQPIVVKGKVTFVESVNQYFVRGDETPGEYIIVNTNSKFLKQLSKSGKIVTIQGRLSGGADLLFIEKIDGKPYREEQAPK